MCFHFTLLASMPAAFANAGKSLNGASSTGAPSVLPSSCFGDVKPLSFSE